MSWNWIQGTGVQQTNGSLISSLPVTFSGLVTAGDLIVVSVQWISTGAGQPTVQDNVNAVNYTYVGPSPSAFANQIGSFYYKTPLGASAGNFTVTVTFPNSSNTIAITLDEFSAGAGASYSVDSSTISTTSGSPGTLTVTGTDLIYASMYTENGGGWTAGTGFTLSYNVGSTSNASAIAAEYLYPRSSNIAPTITLGAGGMNGSVAIAFMATVPQATFSGALLPGM